MNNAALCLIGLVTGHLAVRLTKSYWVRLAYKWDAAIFQRALREEMEKCPRCRDEMAAQAVAEKVGGGDSV